MNNNELERYSGDCLDLEQCDETWRGWHVRGRHLVSGEGWTFTPGEILRLPFLVQQIAALEARPSKTTGRQNVYSSRLTQLHTLQAALHAVEADIAARGTDDELHELRDLRRLP